MQTDVERFELIFEALGGIFVKNEIEFAHATRKFVTFLNAGDSFFVE